MLASRVVLFQRNIFWFAPTPREWIKIFAIFAYAVLTDNRFALMYI